MNQIYHDASLAMSAAYELSKRLHKVVYRHQGTDGRGNQVWLVSFESDADKALRECHLHR